MDGRRRGVTVESSSSLRGGVQGGGGAENIFILQTPGVGRRWQPRRDSRPGPSLSVAARE